MKFYLAAFSFFLLLNNSSCFEIKGDPFCDWKYVEDYARIPLTMGAELIRLNGDNFWAFDLKRNRIDSPIVSTFMNVKLLGIKDEGFILTTEDFVFQEHKYLRSCVIVYKKGTEKQASVFYNNKSIDSVLEKNKAQYIWYNVNSVWEKFKAKNATVPWCK
jgi:hypothetical protein